MIQAENIRNCLMNNNVLSPRDNCMLCSAKVGTVQGSLVPPAAGKNPCEYAHQPHIQVVFKNGVEKFLERPNSKPI